MSRFTVAIDGRPLQAATLGGAARHVMLWLPLVATEVDVVMLTDARGSAPAAVPGVEVVPLSMPPRLPGLAWLELAAGRWLRRRRVLFHGTYYAIPLSYRGPAVTTLHDVSWETHPEDFGTAKRWIWRRYGRHAARRSGRLLTVSEFSRSQLVEVYGVDPDTVVLAPDAVDPWFHPGQAEQFDRVRSELGLTEPFVVTLGGAARRGLGEAVEAWRQARAALGPGTPLDLAVLGSEAPPSEPGIHWLGRIDDDAWASVLASARALVYATRFEGYGLPAAEAAASGTPVVCAPVASLPEVLGDAAAWAAEPTGAALGRRLVELLTDEDQHADLRARGLARMAAAPKAADVAEAVLGAYRAAWDT